MFDCHLRSSIFSQALATLDLRPPSHQGTSVYSLVTKELSCVSRASARLSRFSLGFSLSAARFVLHEIRTDSHEIDCFSLAFLLFINVLSLHILFFSFLDIFFLRRFWDLFLLSILVGLKIRLESRNKALFPLDLYESCLLPSLFSLYHFRDTKLSLQHGNLIKNESIYLFVGKSPGPLFSNIKFFKAKAD